MDKLRSLSTAVDGISVCVALLLQNIVVDRIIPVGASPTIYRLISIPLVVFAIQILRFLSLQLISHSGPILRRVLRGDYIEGAWFGRSAGKPDAIINIEFRGQDIYATGTVFDDNREIILLWRTLSARYDGDVLRYWCTFPFGASAGRDEAYGYCEIQFERNTPRAVPHSYSGKFVDVSGHFEQLRIEATRITDKTVLKRLKTREGTRQAFHELAAACGGQSQ